MKTLKLKTAFAMETVALNDAEFGRLVRGMLQYASSGTEPTLNGTERVLWPNAKAEIDKQLKTYANQCNGMEKTRAQKSTQISDRNLIDIYKKSNRYLPEEKEESGEGKEPKEKLSPLNPLVKEKQEKQEGKGEREFPLSQVPPHAQKPRKFIPPTLDEVRAYCRQRNSSVDPVQFYDYFTADPSRAWIDAKGQPVLNWKSKIVTWEKFNVMPKKSKPVDDGRATNNIFLQLLDEMEAQQNGQK